MNELLLIDMISELDMNLLEDDYMEKDLKKRVPFFKKLFSFKNKEEVSKEFPIKDSYDYAEGESTPDYKETTCDIESMEIFNNETGINSEDELAGPLDRGFNISIFKKNFNNLIKVISGITATFLLVFGILFLLLRKNKSGLKTLKKKVQIIY